MTGAGPSGYTNDAGRDVSRYVQVELREVGELHVVGHAPATPHHHDGSATVPAGVLLTLFDSVGGLCGGLAALPDGWVVSTNLAARFVPSTHAGPLRTDAHVLRRGRTSVIAEVTMHDEGRADAFVGRGIVTSAILVPENGPPVWDRPLVLSPGEPFAGELPTPSAWLGARRTGNDDVEMEISDVLRNPWGILHGGAVATLVDLAATAVAGPGTVTTDVVLHFLAPNRVGPVRAHARVLGDRSDGRVVRVEVRDEGADRVTAVAFATVTATARV